MVRLASHPFHASQGGPVLRWAGAGLLSLVIAGCAGDPERMLQGEWQEVSWRYEKIDHPDSAQSKWIDGIRFRDYSDRRVVRHEAERWIFEPGRGLEIQVRDGDPLRARWRLKGRGHVLTIRYTDTGDLEVYDIKELSRDKLILHFDMGMEVRGVARLEFKRVSDALDREEPGRASRPTKKESRS
jgi:hypothetical protein